MERLLAALSALAQTVEARRGADTAGSYTASLLAGGVGRCAKKFGEEAVETCIAAAQGDAAGLAAESADMLYHWLVLLAAAEVTPDSVAAELERRAGVSGLDEKAARGR